MSSSSNARAQQQESSTTAEPGTAQATAGNGTNMVSNVADIFHAAGYAFKKLSELIQTMDPTWCSPTAGGNGSCEQQNGSHADDSQHTSQFQGHWDQGDVDQFSTIVNGFADELNHLTENLKNKIANRLKEEHREAKIKSLTPEEQEMIVKGGGGPAAES